MPAVPPLRTPMTPPPGSSAPRPADAPAPRTPVRPEDVPALNPSGLDPALLDKARNGRVDALVFLKAPKDGSSGLADALAGVDALPRGADRKVQAAQTLRALSDSSLRVAQPTLDQLTKSGEIAGVDRLWSFNAVRVRGASADALQQLAAANAQAIIPDELPADMQPGPAAGAGSSAARNAGVGALPFMPQAYADELPTPTSAAPEPPAGGVYMGWGVAKMKAAEAWKKGITGAGVTVASLDTGVITEHPGLKANFRGTRADGTQDFNYNWFNGVEKTDTPIDDVGHGTHTIGNVVGNDPTHLAGVAPDAKFITARGLGEAGGTMFGLFNAMEWMLAPTDLQGRNAKPEMAPDVIVNSWGGGTQAIPFLWVGLRNWRRAGIVPVFAAGNTGRPGAPPHSVSSPGLHEETITVGASEKDDSRAFFSNRGPSDYAKDVKPEVVAPGSKIFSTVPNLTYSDTITTPDGRVFPWSGTSMATPHVVGAIALYLQANPQASFDEIRGALERTATHPHAKNNDTGYGRVQVDKLISQVSPSAKLTPKQRVDELMDQVRRSTIYGEEPATVAPAAAVAS